MRDSAEERELSRTPAAKGSLDVPARAPGRDSLVDNEARHGGSGKPAASVGKRTQVEAAGYRPGAGGAEHGELVFEIAVAEVRRHTEDLQAALGTGDRAKAAQAARALEQALAAAREQAAHADSHVAAQRMGVVAELTAHAEPLLAQAREGLGPDEIAARGTQGGGTQLPHLDRIQASFGRHDIRGVQAHVGGQAEASSRELGAHAFARGNHVAFAGTPSLHTAAHEAAHVVQQRGGVQLKALDGGSGDSHERHADAVADAVVSGGSAEALLDRGAGGGAPGVQRKSDPPKADGAHADDKDKKDRGGRPPKGSGTPPKNDPAHAGGGGKPAKTGGPSSKGGGGGGGAPAFSAKGIDGKPLQTQVAALQTAVTTDQGSIKNPEGANGKPKKDSEEDHAKKVSQYEDGIDGIASMIGDLDAFDDLCSGCSDWGEDKGKQQTALAGIRASKAFHQLSQMWQGALDGGPDSAKMQAAFDREFTRRGFWGSTQRAYDIVREDAKRQAKEDAAAAEAKKKAKDAAAKKAAEAAAGDKLGKAQAGQGKPGGINPGAAGGAGGAGLDAVVQAQMAPMPAFAQLSKVTDGDLGKVMASVDHRAGLTESAPKLGAQAPRYKQILDQLSRGGTAFKNEFIDTVKWGVVANVGEKLVGGIVEKGLGEKVPVVGPIIMLALAPPWKADYWTGENGVVSGFKSGGKEFSHAWSDLKAFKNVHSAKDAFGVYCAVVADLFAGFHDILNTLNTLIGTLSALCLILGAVLIGVGIALCWLGIGEALMAAGGWLVEAGEVLGDISMALIPVCLALSALSLVFRTAAAALVPSDMYAEQLAETGDAADKFGEMAGQKAGLDASHTIEHATEKPEGHETSGPEGTKDNAKAEGAEDGKQIADKVKGSTDAMADTASKAEATKPAKPEAKPATGEGDHATKPDEHATKPDEHATKPDEHAPKPDEHAQRPDEHAETKDKHADADKEKPKGEADKEEPKEGDKEEGKDDKDDKDKKKGVRQKIAEIAKEFGRRLGESAKVSNDLGRNLERLGSSLKELGELRHGRAAAEKGLETHAEAAREALEETGKQAQEQQAKIDELLEKLDAEDGKLTEDEKAEINKQIKKALDAWGDAKAKGDRLQKRISTIEQRQQQLRENAEKKRKAAGKTTEDPGENVEQEPEDKGDAAEDDSGEPKSTEEKRRKAEDTAREKRQELEKAKEKATKLEAEQQTAEGELEAAKARKAKAEAESKAALDKLESDPANKAKMDSAARVEAHDKALSDAKAMHEKAGRIRSAEHARKTVGEVLDKTVGTVVDVGGEPHKITGFSADGVVVEPAAGGERRAVPADQVKGDLPADFQKNAGKLQKAYQSIDTETKGETGGNAGAVADKLDDTANSIEKTERKKYKPGKNQEKWSEDKKRAAEWKEQREQAEAPAKEADSDLERAEKALEKTKDEIQENKHEQRALEHEAHEQEEQVAELRREAQRHRRSEKAKEKLAAYVGKKVGVDTAIDWIFQVTHLEDALHHLHDFIESKVEVLEGPLVGKSQEEQEKMIKDAEAKGEEGGGKSEKEAKQSEPTEPGAKGEPKPGEGDAAKGEKGEPNGGNAPDKADKKEGGEDKESASEKEYKEALKIGAAQAMYEQLIALRPPPDVALLGQHREKASTAAKKAKESHDWAYKCYQAELAVGKIAHQTKEMAESGKPLHNTTKQMAAPLQKSKGDEQGRAATLAGAQTGDVKGADSRMGGLVVDLIQKLSDHSDRLSQKPDAGGASGDQMAGGQDKADSESKHRHGQSKSFSNSQQQFLDAALQTRASQDASVAQSIQTLEGKQQQELAMRDQIRQRKAKALADEQAARQEAETEAAAFNDGYSRASAWATSYERKRAELKGGSGGEK